MVNTCEASKTKRARAVYDAVLENYAYDNGVRTGDNYDVASSARELCNRDHKAAQRPRFITMQI